MDYEWRVHGYLYIIHVSQGILFVTTRHAIQVERISTIPISAIFRCASLRSLGFPGFHPPPPNSDCISFYFGRHRIQPMISLGAACATKDHFGGILSFSDFPRNHQIEKYRLFNVPRDSFRRNSGASMRDRCPVIFQPLDYSKNVFLLTFSWLASRWRLAGAIC